MKNKKALAGILLTLTLAGGIIAPVATVLAADETTSVAPAAEVVTEAPAPAAEAPAPVAEAPATAEVQAAEPVVTEAAAPVVAEAPVVTEAPATEASTPVAEAPAPVATEAPVAPAAEAAPVATETASVTKRYGIYVEVYKAGEFLFDYSSGRLTSPPTMNDLWREGLSLEDAEFKVANVELNIDQNASNSDITWYSGKIYLEPKTTVTTTTEPKTTVTTTTEPKTTVTTTTEPKTTVAVTPSSNGGKGSGSAATEPKKVLPNTGETTSVLAVIGLVLLSFVGLIGATYRHKE